MPSPIQITSGDPDHYIQEKRMDLEAGVLGKFFGGERNAALNIAGIVACLLLVPGIVMLFVTSVIPPMEYWKAVLPVLSGILGYLFGRAGHRGD